MPDSLQQTMFEEMAPTTTQLSRSRGLDYTSRVAFRQRRFSGRAAPGRERSRRGSDYFALGLRAQPGRPAARLLGRPRRATRSIALRFRDVDRRDLPTTVAAHLLRRRLVGRLAHLLLHGPRRGLPAVPGLAAPAGHRRRPTTVWSCRRTTSGSRSRRGLPLRRLRRDPRRVQGHERGAGWCRRPEPAAGPSWSSRGVPGVLYSVAHAPRPDGDVLLVVTDDARPSSG